MKHLDRILSFAVGCAVTLLVVFVAASWPTRPEAPTKEEVAEMRVTIAQALSKVESLETQLQEAEARRKQDSARAAAEDAARRAADIARLKEAQEAARREAARRTKTEAIKNAEAVKEREAAATKAREDMKKAQDAAKRAAEERSRRQQMESDSPNRRPMSRSERERAEDERLAQEALRKAGKAPPQQQPVSAPSPPPVLRATEFETLYEQALKMESDGNVMDAIRVYRRAARAGNGNAAKRLGEIFDCGRPGVPRDYAESLQWYETARQLGVAVETAGRRDLSGSSCPAAARSESPNQNSLLR